MKVWMTGFLLLGLGASGGVSAGVNANGEECIKELCTGDWLTTQQIPWKPLRLDRADIPIDSAVEEVKQKKAVIGDASTIKALAVPLHYGIFDSSVLKNLWAGSVSVCKSINIWGSYTTQSGLPTKVFLTSLAGPASNGVYVSGFHISGIMRCYPGQDARAVRDALKQEYPDLADRNDVTYGKSRARFEWVDATCGGSPSLSLSSKLGLASEDAINWGPNEEANIQAQFDRIPACAALVKPATVE